MTPKESFLLTMNAMVLAHCIGIAVSQIKPVSATGRDESDVVALFKLRQQAGQAILFASQIPEEELPSKPEELIQLAEKLISYLFCLTDARPDCLPQSLDR